MVEVAPQGATEDHWRCKASLLKLRVSVGITRQGFVLLSLSVGISRHCLIYSLLFNALPVPLLRQVVPGHDFGAFWKSVVLRSKT